MIDTWKCHICGDERPDEYISVFTRDTSANNMLPPGTVTQNVRYCNDKEDCTEKAKTYDHFKKGKQ